MSALSTVSLNLLAPGSGIPIWVSPLVLLFIIGVLGIYYKITLKKSETFEDMPRLTFLIYIMIRWISKTTYDIVGKSYRFAVPFFIYIIFYFWLGGIVSVLGIPSPSNKIEVPATVSLLVFIGTILSGLVHHRWFFVKDFFIWIKFKKQKIFLIPDPLKFIGELSKVVSLSCRLWGNCLAGSVILFVGYYSLDSLFESLNASWAAVIAIPSVMFPFHIYFDIIDGGLQAGIFMFLTMSYWAIASQTIEPNINEHK